MSSKKSNMSNKSEVKSESKQMKTDTSYKSGIDESKEKETKKEINKEINKETKELNKETKEPKEKIVKKEEKSSDEQLGGRKQKKSLINRKKNKKPISKKHLVKRTQKKKSGNGNKKSTKNSEYKEQTKDEDQKESNTYPKVRYFKVVVDGGNAHGRFSGTKPKQAANKALTSILKTREKNGQHVGGQIKFSIIECTRGSKHKQYNYIGERIKLDSPMLVTIGKGPEAKVIEYKYNNKVMKEKAN